MKHINTLLFFLFITSAHAQTSLEQLDLKTGNFGVGFKHIVLTDSTRTYQHIYDFTNSTVLRPIPTSIWYPTDKSQKQTNQLLVADYMQILKEEEEWESLPNEQILNWFYYAPTPENKKHFLELTKAQRDRPPAAGSFPVIVYAPSYQASSIENFALCEYLASYGYVVISSPSRGGSNRFFEGGTLKDLETQARDIEFLIGKVSHLPYADSSKIATMGFSFGGLANVLAQMRNTQLKAIVSLDGSIKYQYETLKKSGFYNIKNVDVPFIHMAQKDIPKAVLKADGIDPSLNNTFEFFEDLQFSKAYKLKFHHLTHSQFSTLGVLFQERDPRQDKSDTEIMTSYKLISLFTLKFLDAYLKNNLSALSFLRSSMKKNEIDTTLISKESKKPIVKSFSFRDFHEQAIRNNYIHLEKLYDSLKKKYPDLELKEGALNTLGLQLTFNKPKSDAGIKIFLLAVALYPDSSNLYDSLAEAYLYQGNKQKAIINFKKSLRLNSQNQNAINRLKQLQN